MALRVSYFRRFTNQSSASGLGCNTKGDNVFLLEILTDLKEEAVSKNDRILRGIKSRTFTEVENASYIVKGSASLLFCADLVNAADKLMRLSTEGSSGIEEAAVKDSSIVSQGSRQPRRDPEAIWVDIEAAHIEFGKCVTALSAEMNAHFEADDA